MRKNILITAVVTIFMVALLSVAQAASDPASVHLPVVVDISVIDMDTIVVHFATPIASQDIAWVRFNVDNHTNAVSQELSQNGLSIRLQLNRRLSPGSEHVLVLENWLRESSVSYDFVAVEVVAIGALQEKISTRNTAVKMTRNAIAIVEAGHEALLEGRQAIFDTYGELDSAIRDFPELELPFSEPEGEFEERINDLVTEAHVQAKAALVSNREALVDQIISLEHQREDLLTNLTKTRLQSEMAIRQLTLAAEAYVFAYHSMSAQLTGLEGNLNLLKRQLSIMDIQVSLGLVTTHEAEKMSHTARELQNAMTTLTQQRQGMVAELNLLLGQSHDTPLHFVEPVMDFDSLTEEVDYARDLPQVRSRNLNMQSLAADVVQQAKAVERNATGSQKRTVAEYELQNARIRYAEEERKLALSFKRLADDLSAKASSLNLSEKKLQSQSALFRYAALRYELGMISAMQLESERLELLTAGRSREEAQRDLLMALHRYRFMLDGLTL